MDASYPYPRMSEEGKIFSPEAKACNRVIILGMGASMYQYQLLMYNNHRYTEGAQVWALNAAAHVFRHDLAFQIHEHTLLEKLNGPDWWKLYDNGIPVVMQENHPELPNSREYPFGEIIDHIQEIYFRNSSAYAIALALLSGAEEIELFGHDYNYSTKSKNNSYELGRCNVEYWLGLAKFWDGDRNSRCRIKVPATTTLLDTCERLDPQTSFYGYSDKAPIITSTESGYVHAGFGKGSKDFENIQTELEKTSTYFDFETED